MSETHSPGEDPVESVFHWHPDYLGKTVSDVRSSLIREITSDQRAYALTLEGAEEHEGDSLSSVIALERKWAPFDLNWAETDPGLVADRVVAFELERDRRQELFPYGDYRRSVAPLSDTSAADPVAAQRLESPVARGIVVLAIIVIIVVAWFFLFR